MAENATIRSAGHGGRYAHWHVDPPEEREEEGWLLVYLDVMTLLLVMLVVLLAFSDRTVGTLLADPRPQPQAVSGGPGLLDGGRGVLDGSTGLLDGQPALVEQPGETDVERMEEAAAGEDGPVPDPLAGLPLDMLGDDIEVLVQEGTISFRISNEILFPSGQAQLTGPGLGVLDRLVEVLNATDHKIAVEGHTDDIPIQTERFPSNWELSTGRATSVVRFLEANGVDSRRLRATGYSDTRPIAGNETPEGRATNRRVELIMETRPES